ncbi:MAG: DnaB-like helicase N-terminal domain-containing protein, partial [Phycisphaerae bacterium]|nr:DnaB-like helicase N-terminal domain-containing protein [Phycisphaerae bacterium]
MAPKVRQNLNKKAQPSAKTDVSSSSQLIGRTMPESLEAEAAVLGSMILDPECIGQVVQQITAGAFYRIEHQMIFDAIVSQWEKKNEKFDLLLLRDELKNRKQLEEIGGAEYLVKVAEA